MKKAAEKDAESAVRVFHFVQKDTGLTDQRIIVSGIDVLTGVS